MRISDLHITLAVTADGKQGKCLYVGPDVVAAEVAKDQAGVEFESVGRVLIQELHTRYPTIEAEKFPKAEKSVKPKK